MRMSFSCWALALLLPGVAVAAEPALTFEQHVRPILKTHCFRCHGEKKSPKGGLDLRLRRLMIVGGESGEAIRPGRRADSFLFERISEGEMPPGKKKLTTEEIDLIGRWIDGGAKTMRAEPKKLGAGLRITPEERSFWAFKPIERPLLPRIAQPELVRTSIDAFLLKKLQERRLSFSPEADRRTLIRRAYFDLWGLPPEPEDVARFIADDAPDAYERLIDRLLASPHYGERWGRHWLDVAGYADSEGYTNDDAIRPHAYKYRDWVIAALNDDKPLDEFIRQQLAGDEMVTPPHKNLSPGDVEKLIATGFLRMAADGTGSGGVDQAVARNETIADTIKIVSTSLLGLSVGCARCHNHRYDPISQVDYYRFRAIFAPAYDWKNWQSPKARRISLYTDQDRQKAAEIEKQAAKIDAQRTKQQQQYILRTFNSQLAKLAAELREPIRKARNTPDAKRTPQQKKLLKDHPSVNVTAGSLYLYDRKAADDLKRMAAEAAKVRSTKPVEQFVRALTERPGSVPATHLFSRGDHTQPRETVLPGGLKVLASSESDALPTNDPALPTTGRRLAWARRITDAAHPLTTRVIVNRVWMRHFGRGIVATPGDFGALGERPTHPQLLDWLASDLMARGWRLKPLHRLIMTSAAYRQSSRRSGPLEKLDPDNRLLGRMSVRRLDAESIRDSVLAVAGTLNPRMAGAPVPVMEDEVGQFVIGIENKNGENRQVVNLPLHGEEFRRSVYVQARRSRPLAVLETFDLPVMAPNCTARTASTAAPQSLLLMNSRFVMQFADMFARRVRRDAGDSTTARIQRAWQLAFSRDATSEEVAAATVYLAEQAQLLAKTARASGSDKKDHDKKKGNDPQLRALAVLCQALLSSNEFLYVD